jgi:hypothetical protein
MEFDQIQRPSTVSATRRQVIARATKLAYVPPLVAASFRLTTSVVSADEVISGGVICPEPVSCGTGDECVLFPTALGDVCGLDRLCDEVAPCSDGCAPGEVCATTCGCSDKPTSCVAPCGTTMTTFGLATATGRRQSGRTG